MTGSAGQLVPMSAADWDAAYRRGSWVWDEPPPAALLELLRAHLPAPATVADLGCGVGTTARALAALGYSVHGFDQSPVAIELARSRTEPGLDCRFTVLDVVREAGSVPAVRLVIDRGVLHTCCNPPAQAGFVAALARICRPGSYWLHVGAAMTDAEGSTWFTHGPSALADTDFERLVRPYFSIVELRRARYGDNPGETDFAARAVMLHRLPGTAGPAG